MATVNLGRIKFVWQGAYNAATAYVADDVVSYNGSSYICILASTGNLPTNTTYWNQMSSAGTNGTNGTNGTDVGTVITTQGDLLYRDASGLQRLGAGSSGQVLITGGAGANPSWSTPSTGAMVFLASQTVTGSSTTLDFNGYFTSEYDTYKLFVSEYFVSTNFYLRLRVATTGSYTVDSSSSYTFCHANGHYQGSADTNYNNVWNTGNNQDNMIIGYGSSSTNAYLNGEYTFHNPRSTSSAKSITGLMLGGDTTFYTWGTTFGVWKNNTAITGFRLLNTAGNLNGTFRLYGIKNS